MNLRYSVNDPMLENWTLHILEILINLPGGGVHDTFA